MAPTSSGPSTPIPGPTGTLRRPVGPMVLDTFIGSRTMNGAFWDGTQDPTDYPAAFQSLNAMAAYFATPDSGGVKFTPFTMPWVSKTVGVLVTSVGKPLPNLNYGMLYFNSAHMAQAWFSFGFLNVNNRVVRPLVGVLTGYPYVAVAMGVVGKPSMPAADDCLFLFDPRLPLASGFGAISPI